MLDLFMIILLIVSLFKPDVLLSKKIKEKASEEQKNILVRNFRKMYGISVFMLETIFLSRYLSDDITNMLILVYLVELIIFFIFVIPAIKENRKIIKELK